MESACMYVCMYVCHLIHSRGEWIKPRARFCQFNCKTNFVPEIFLNLLKHLKTKTNSIAKQIWFQRYFLIYLNI